MYADCGFGIFAGNLSDLSYFLDELLVDFGSHGALEWIARVSFQDETMIDATTYRKSRGYANGMLALNKRSQYIEPCLLQICLYHDSYLSSLTKE